MKSTNILSGELLASSARIIDSFTRHGCTLGLSESVTGGTIASCLARVDGCSKVLFASQVLYSIYGKSSFLELVPEKIEEEGTVSEFIINRMNDCMTQRFFKLQKQQGGEISENSPLSFIAIATCGVAGSAIENLRRGTVIIGMDVYIDVTGEIDIITPSRHEVEWFQFDGDRATIILEATRTALSWLEDVSFISSGEHI